MKDWGLIAAIIWYLGSILGALAVQVRHPMERPIIRVLVALTPMLNFMAALNIKTTNYVSGDEKWR